MELTTITTTTPSENSEAQEALTSAETTTVNEAQSPRPPAAKSHRIDLSPAFRTDPATGRSAGQGMAIMSYEGVQIGESRQPAFDAARWLLKHGLALPSDRLTTYRDGMPCIFTTVGRAAKLALEESANGGIKIRAYREPSVETLKALRETKAAAV